MCKLLMSINPEHVDNILAGTKKFEFRKNKCKEEIDSIIIYSTSPIMRVVAEVEVKELLKILLRLYGAKHNRRLER